MNVTGWIAMACAATALVVVMFLLACSLYASERRCRRAQNNLRQDRDAAYAAAATLSGQLTAVLDRGDRLGQAHTVLQAAYGTAQRELGQLATANEWLNGTLLAVRGELIRLEHVTESLNSAVVSLTGQLGDAYTQVEASVRFLTEDMDSGLGAILGEDL
jgi:hypothetical protein